MNIVIPMAGKGSRFAQCGFSLPKPLISVGGKPMYQRSIDSLPLRLASQVVFILNSSSSSDAIEEDIKRYYYYLPKYKILKIAKTEGQAETVLLSEEYLNISQPTLVHNCDTEIEENFEWEKVLDKNIDGAIVLFHSNEKRWSYAKLDEEEKYVTDIQEKKVISPYATTGTYFFKNTKSLLTSVQNNIKNNLRENNEFYLSTVYRSMLNENKKIIPLWIKSMHCFGTPQDLVESLNEMILMKEKPISWNNS